MISQRSPSPEPQDPISGEELSGGGDNEELSGEDHSRKNTKPLLKEVTFLGSGKGRNPGGTKQFQCNHCKKSFSGSYTRIFNHFFGPPPGKPAGITRCPVISSSREKLQKLRKRIEDDEKAGLSPSITKSTISNKGVAATVKPIMEAFGTMERHQVDLAITKALCSNGIPFNVLRNPDFIAMVKAINHAPSDYSPPPYDRARTTLLDDCYREVEKELAPVKDTWTSQGTSIISDGWTNVKHQPLINVVASNSRGSMFMYADNFSGVEKTGKEIADYLLKSIDEVGPSNVLQVVTDNAENCKAARKEIEKVHKHIFWSPCTVHTLNLIFKDFANVFPWMLNTYKKGKNIVKFFLNHDQAHAIFRAQSGLELLKVAKTRFASHYILLSRLRECREALATTTVLRSWKDWVGKGDERIRNLGAEVALTIADEEFWDEVDNILAITKPIYLMIKFADGEGQKMGEVYEKMDCMIGEIGDIMKNNKHVEYRDKMQEILIARWEKMNIPMHCLGFALNPFYYDSNYLTSAAPGGVERRAPNLDREVVSGVLEAFDKIGEDVHEKKLLREQMAKFQQKEGIFGINASKIDAVTMSPISWWSTYGSETPELAEIAVKVLSQPITSSFAERVWSTYSYIHNIKRNRINALRADKLVFIHSNLRLISRFTKSYTNGPYRMWDIDPESSYIGDSTLRMDDIRWVLIEDNATNKRKRS